ncbi:DUF1684 domain-containing protein [Polluticoccus soli]|uniref:DUF1684 domain-containing protein n=1 Tax=Polluticoccus soli TaxID=3034150 RepID=UPI0023E1D686|nr:DUF1684 domain-containing protein [Flavipsychrobacter sp. JY13-12]
MRSIFFAALLMACFFDSKAQTYRDSIILHRQHYKEEFVTEERSPLKGNDTAYLRFFAPDERFKVNAELTLTPDAKEFDMPTHSGKKKLYRQYGLLTFRLKNKTCSLQVFQSQALLKDPKYKDHLFVPFTDLTTYEETYGGGRYIDLSLKDINNGKIAIDFNKAYNPYCAYADGFNCPIPPRENRLPVSIKAGEKLFGKGTEH